jgi:non-specific serine/threonine protein kinase
MALAERAEPDLGGPTEGAWLDRLEREHDNIRAALAWLGGSDQVEAGLRASRPLWRFWSVRGYLAEGREWLTALLVRDDAPTTSWARARALSSAGWMALEQDDVAAARMLCEQGLALSRECGDDELVAEHLAQLGHTARQQGEYARAEALYEESLATGGTLSPRSEVAGTLGYLGNALLRAGDVDGAHRRQAESLAICREIGHRRRMAYAIEGLAGVAVARGLSNRRIADELVISEATAAVHVKHILHKLDLASRVQVAVWAARHGIVAAPAT